MENNETYERDVAEGREPTTGWSGPVSEFVKIKRKENRGGGSS